MRLIRLSVQGFRSLRDVTVPMDPLTSFIGPNGSGKSSLLAALRIAFDPRAAVDERDFWRSGEGQVEGAEEISIAMTFGNLSNTTRQVYENYLDGQGCLTVERYFNQPGSGVYLARRLAAREFAAIRNLPKGHRDAFNELGESGQFSGLEQASSKDEAFLLMAEWERSHPDECEFVSEEVRFFSEIPPSPTATATHIKSFFVGAMEDPGQHLEEVRSGGAIVDLLQETVRTPELQRELEGLTGEVAGKVNEVLRERNKDFDALFADVGEVLNQFAPGFSLKFAWEEFAPTQSSPKVKVSVATSDGLVTDLRYQGQGVQRSLMYGILTAQVGTGVPEDDEMTLLLIIEEPEAFQHPLSARVLARTLYELSCRHYQVVFSTHSPHLIHPEAIAGIRLVQRGPDQSGAFQSSIDSFCLEELARDMREATGLPGVTAETVAARLRANLETRILEGLFARACVLVEGDEDEALVRSACSLDEVNLDELGIAIIQTRGKAGMPLALAFLRHAGVKTYPLFDLDRNKDPEDWNVKAEKAMLTLLGADASEELTGNTVRDEVAYWDHDLGACVEEEIGATFGSLLEDVSEKLGYSPNQGRKVSPVLHEVLRRARGDGLSSSSLSRLSSQIAKLSSDSAT